MNAILVTGNTYPHRRTLARSGGRWSAERGGYLFGADQLNAVLNAWGELDGLSYANVEADDAELAPPSYADRRAAQADRHARRADRLEARADSRDRKVQTIEAKLQSNPLFTDFGLATEPIKHDHHSGARHARDKARINSQIGQQVQAWRESAELRGRAAAEAARGMADAERSVSFMVRRMDELTAVLRKAERDLAGESFHGHDRSKRAEPKSVDPNTAWGRKLTAERDEAAEGLAYWRALLDAAGGLAFSRETLKPGMIVSTRWGNARVVRANAKTVSVVYVSGGLDGRGDKRPYAEIAAIIEEVMG